MQKFMVKCICINSENQPAEIPVGLWPHQGFEYHITHVHYHPLQGLQGVDLKEIRLTPECYPYKTYKLSRFAFTLDGLLKLAELMKACTELNDVDISKAIKEMDLEIIEN